MIPPGLVVCDVNPFGIDLGFGMALGAGSSLLTRASPVYSPDAEAKVVAFEANSEQVVARHSWY